MKILIAEDSATIRRKLELLLEDTYEIVSCKDGLEAWKVIQTDDTPNLLVLDWLMPGMDGTELCRKVRELDKAAYMYIILLTVKDKPQDIIEGMEAGADDYMVKPFSQEELEARIKAGKRILNLNKKLYQANKYSKTLIDSSLDMVISLDENSNIVTFNRAAEREFGFKKEEVSGKQGEMLYLEPSQSLELQNTIKHKGKFTGEVLNRRKDGSTFVSQISASLLRNEKNDIVGTMSLLRNITKRKQKEDELKLLNESLEQRIAERTEALEKKNIALNELLGQLELEKKHIKDNVTANAENLLLPIIQRLRLKGESRKYVNLLQKNLQELTSSFGTTLVNAESKLSPREMEICNMIKNGLANKEICSLLNISPRTTEKHRENIRKKLGIINKELNLTSFLNTI